MPKGYPAMCLQNQWKLHGNFHFCAPVYSSVVCLNLGMAALAQLTDMQLRWLCWSGNKYRYVGHPLYQQKLASGSTRFSPQLRFVFIGRIMPYKGLPELLSLWPSGTELAIYGKALDQAYVDELLKLVKARRLNVSIENRFIPDDEVSSLMAKADVMVLPHSQDTAIVSGGFYLAKTYGCMILTSDDRFVEFGVEPFKGGNSLHSAVSALTNLSLTITKQDVFDQAFESHSEVALMQDWQKCLNNL